MPLLKPRTFSKHLSYNSKGLYVQVVQLFLVFTALNKQYSQLNYFIYYTQKMTGL